jgi:hypothetical protein
MWSRGVVYAGCSANAGRMYPHLSAASGVAGRIGPAAGDDGHGLLPGVPRWWFGNGATVFWLSQAPASPAEVADLHLALTSYL